MLADYFRLIRLPNLFTVPSNVLAGYFALVEPVQINTLQLCLLAASSILLYTSGIVLNDYFDIETDLKERPYRPLPSKRIPKRRAVVIAFVSIITANLLALSVSMNSGIISVLLSAVVIGYDYKFKKTNSGPIAMATARSLNIVLGASPALYLALGNQILLMRLVFIILSTFAYVFSISILSKKEVQVDLERSEQQKKVLHAKRAAVFISLFTVSGITVSFIFLIFIGIFSNVLIVNLVLFVAIISVVLFNQIRLRYSSSSVQNSVKYMIIAIIVLDSVVVSGTAGLSFGISVMLFTIPSIFLSKTLYMT